VDKKVLVFVPSFMGMIDSQVVESLLYIQADCAEWKDRGFKFYPMIGKRMNVHDARNNAVQWAIDNGMDYIFWFDDDMVVEKADNAKPLFSTLMAHDKDFVAPLFFQRRPPFMPLLFKRNQYKDGIFTTYDNIMDYEKGLLEVDGVGFGCALTKVEMLKKIEKPWFVMGDSFGEDLYFCEKAKQAGFEIYCDTSVQVGHIGDPPIAWESSYKKNRGAADLFFKQKIQRDKEYVNTVGGVADVCMPIYHNYEITKNAIESILNNTLATTINLKLVVDGADKKIENYLKKISKHWKNIEYVVNKKSVGCVKATNQALRMATSPYVCFVNNDIEVPENMKHWLHRMIQLLKVDKVGAVSCVSNYVAGIQNIQFNTTMIGTECFAKYLIPFVAVFKKEVLDKVGLFDESFQEASGASSGADIDLSLRIAEAGYQMMIARDVFIVHYGSKSNEKAAGSMDNVMEMHEKYVEILKDKWGSKKIEEIFNTEVV
jgi:GT2 family glycosyltransferase